MSTITTSVTSLEHQDDERQRRAEGLIESTLASKIALPSDISDMLRCWASLPTEERCVYADRIADFVLARNNTNYDYDRTVHETENLAKIGIPPAETIVALRTILLYLPDASKMAFARRIYSFMKDHQFFEEGLFAPTKLIAIIEHMPADHKATVAEWALIDFCMPRIKVERGDKQKAFIQVAQAIVNRVPETDRNFLLDRHKDSLDSLARVATVKNAASLAGLFNVLASNKDLQFPHIHVHKRNDLWGSIRGVFRQDWLFGLFKKAVVCGEPHGSYKCCGKPYLGW
ncbi:MAG: hypothetical protein L6Q57_01970 [Alphaproteobacteria bacterium]|nr:hypothetical protein [Alphaproteobacteria bacterium]